MQNMTPFNMNLRTLEDVDKAAEFLSEQWNKSFPPAPRIDSKKRNALRDMVCRLAGFANGLTSFESFLEHSKIPKPSQDFDLPDDVNIKTSYELSHFLFLGKGTGGLDYTNKDNEDLCPDHKDYLATIYCAEDYLDEGALEDFDPNTDNHVILRDKELWRYIAHNYYVQNIVVTMPNISKYGSSELGTTEGAESFIDDIFLEVNPERDIYDILTAVDRGDDGSETVGIWLRRKDKV